MEEGDWDIGVRDPCKSPHPHLCYVCPWEACVYLERHPHNAVVAMRERATWELLAAREELDQAPEQF
jgi:hypothetical protein